VPGERFSRWVVLRYSHTDKHSNSMWECRCDCGHKSVVSIKNLRRGFSKSCGCLRVERQRIHGCSRMPEYIALNDAIQRCKAICKDRLNYFDRGITVCKKWRMVRLGFADFFIHIGPNPSPSHSLDRIDNNKGYEPGNVKWSTKKEQKANQRKRLRLEQFSDAEFLEEFKRRGLSVSVK
jgi:hypothetical protein